MSHTHAYPLSPLQAGMLFNTLYRPSAGVDIEQIILTLPEAVDPAALERAWQRLAARHGVLRTEFRWADRPQPEQRIRPAVSVPFAVHDLTDQPAAAHQRQLEEYLAADRRRGFDPAAAPLLRLALFCLAPADHRLVWTFHHILLDGRSFVPLLDEVFADYAALRAGRETDFPRRRPYREFIAWLDGVDGAAAERFWRERLAGVGESTPLPLDRGAPAEPVSGGRLDRQTVILPPDVVAALRRQAARHDLTLNTLVQGAWAILVRRYTGATDVVFGVTRAGRRGTVPDSDDIIGNFINTVPLRATMADGGSVLDLLRQVREFAVATRPHEHTPLARIREWSGVPAGQPLFESLLFFENGQLESRLQARGGDWIRRRAELREQAGFPLSVAAYAEADLELNIIYDPDRFAAADMGRVLGHLQHLLGELTGDLSRSPARLPLLPMAEVRRMVRDWNDESLDYPRQCGIHELFEEWAAQAPERTAVVVDDRHLSYGELNRRANALAWRLRERGVVPDERVAIRLDRSPEQLVAILGVLKAGAAYLPLDPIYPPHRLRVMLEDARACILIGADVDHSLPVEHRLVLSPAPAADEAGARADNPPSAAGPDHLAYVMYTSGSMGRPKGVMITHRNVVAFLHAIGRRTRLDVPRIGTSLASYSFDTSVEEIFSCLCFGGTVHLVRPEISTDGAAFARYILAHGINTAYILPNYLVAVAEGLAAHRDRSPLRCLLTGIAPLKQHVLQRFRDLFPDMHIMNCYGPTEVTWGPCSFVFHEAEDPHLVVPIGRPFAGYRMYIVDEHLQPVPVGVAGELLVGGVGVARGYLNRPEETAEKFIPDPFRPGTGGRVYCTGDLARFRADGNVVFVGRRDNQVKIRGYRIELGEIETVLRRHPAVAQAVVICREDPGREKEVVAYLVFEPGDAPAAAELRRTVREQLPLYMMPAAFVSLERIPVTLNGKLDRAALPAPGDDAAEPESAPPADGPLSAAETRIARIWREVLGVTDIGREENFFDLGGDSLAAIRLHDRLKSLGGRELSLVQLYRCSTIAAQARFFDQPAAAAPARDEAIAARVRRRQAALDRWRRDPDT